MRGEVGVMRGRSGGGGGGLAKTKEGKMSLNRKFE